MIQITPYNRNKTPRHQKETPHHRTNNQLHDEETPRHRMNKYGQTSNDLSLKPLLLAVLTCFFTLLTLVRQSNAATESHLEQSSLTESPVSLRSKPVTGTLDRTQSPTPLTEKLADQYVEQTALQPLERKQNKFMVKAQYSPLDMLVLSKWGVAGAYQYSPDWWIEVEYNKGSLGFPGWLSRLGGLSEERFQIQSRQFWGFKTFNTHFGINRISTKLNIGSEALARATSNPDYFQNHVLADTWGIHGGLGNWYVFENGFSFGVDWVSYHQPLYVQKTTLDFERVAGNSQDRNDLRTIKNLMLYSPRITLLKLQIGYSF